MADTTANRSLRGSDGEGGSEWLSVSDMMTGLMVIFLFIALSYMIHVRRQNERMFEIAQTYELLHESLLRDLTQEFKEDLPRWSARIDSSSLSITFTEPDVLFVQGSAEIRPRFRDILDHFFERYVDILYSDKYREQIEEIRIEGHTSSEWQDLDSLAAYFMNMDLSQQRTRSVLKYALYLLKDNTLREWVRMNMTANGLSSSKLVIVNGVEDRKLSRRVEFRVRTNAVARIGEIAKMKD